MLNKAALYILGSSPNISGEAVKLLCRLVAEYDLRKPLSIHPSTILTFSQDYKIPVWKVRRAIAELIDGGLLEEIETIRYTLLPRVKVVKLKKQYWLRDQEGQDMEERLTLLKVHGGKREEIGEPPI